MRAHNFVVRFAEHQVAHLRAHVHCLERFAG